MFCPNCGAEERNRSQFCRACGTELQAVRIALEQPDAITKTALTARKEIGRAIAAKIAEFEDAADLRRAVYEILPVIEGFMQSPEERRLHKLREAVLTTASGIGVMVFFLLIYLFVQSRAIEIISLIGLSGGVLTLLIGLAIIIVNSVWFTRRAESSAGSTAGITKQYITGEILNNDTNRGLESEPREALPSITEGTTRQL
jgi:hypothetical protein